ncbi:MAG TPA: DoxX family protein [Pyrinomonadaceae bacterium]
MLRKIIATTSVWTPLPLRLAMAGVFFAHGAGKVLGTFGGPGLRAFTSGPTAATPFPFMKPMWLWLGAAAISELLGAVLLLLGLLTRVGAFLLLCTMLTAVFGVHWGEGFFAPRGIEFPMTLAAICLALLISGGGMASIDLGLSGRRRKWKTGK